MIVIKGEVLEGDAVKLQAFSGLTHLPASSPVSESCCLQEFVEFHYVGKFN